MENYTDNKKKMLDVRLTYSDNDSPDTLRIIQDAKEGLVRSPDAIPQDRPIEEMVPLSSSANRPSGQNEQAVSAAPTIDERSFFRRFVDRIALSLGGVVPKRGDSPLEVIRKCIFVTAFITLVISLTYIVNEMVLIPLDNSQTYKNISKLYDPDNPVPPPANFPEGDYPTGIKDTFKALYAQNQQVRGWMKYSDSNNKWLNINYPVMFSGDNSYYLNHDFQKSNNKNGALFFDQRTNLETKDAANRVLIIYGHNMASGQMLSPLNKLMSNHNYMRSAPMISLNTLYDERQYQVFSVMLLSTRAQDGPYFDYIRTVFSGDDDYMNFVSNIRARSIYDFNGVDVGPQDELLVLSTCTAVSNAHFKDGRCVVIARRVRDDETVALRPSDIVKNKDVIMPYAWYINQKKTVHPFYTDPNYVMPGLSPIDTQPSGSVPNGTMPTPYLPSDNTTTFQPGGGTTTKPSGSGGETTTSGPGGETTTSGSGGETTTSGSGGETTTSGSGGETTTSGSVVETTTVDDDQPTTQPTTEPTAEPTAEPTTQPPTDE
ncbi:MAG: sortase [Oscillospiraceae bacterium]|nr:sortase [Oscillospiraceae bacterium]MDD4546075.1 sortase [Oscillospiraceae bacterium]